MTQNVFKAKKVKNRMHDREHNGNGATEKRIDVEALATGIDEDDPTDDVESSQLQSSLDIFDVSFASESAPKTPRQVVNYAAPSIGAITINNYSPPADRSSLIDGTPSPFEVPSLPSTGHPRSKPSQSELRVLANYRRQKNKNRWERNNHASDEINNGER